MVGDGTLLLSVVVPMHRVDSYLRTCLDSVLADPGSDLELIAVDDASPDRSADIAAEYASRDPRVTVLRLPVNVGLGPARNAGLDRATGEYVWFVDSDDWLPAGAVAAVRARLAVHRPDVLIVDHVEAYENGRIVRPVTAEVTGIAGPVRLADHPELLRLAQSACTKLVRREFLDEIGLRFFSGWYEDSAFSHPLLMAAQRIDVLDRVCYCYRQRDCGGITKTRSTRHFEAFEQYQRLFETVDKTGPSYEQFRPQLFRLMIDHYLVIVGNSRRVPPRLRAEFFRRMAADFAGRLPAHGYEVPRGTAGLKHRLVRYNAYRTYAVLRLVHRSATRLLSLGGYARRANPGGGDRESG